MPMEETPQARSSTVGWWLSIQGGLHKNLVGLHAGSFSVFVFCAVCVWVWADHSPFPPCRLDPFSAHEEAVPYRGQYSGGWSAGLLNS